MSDSLPLNRMAPGQSGVVCEVNSSDALARQCSAMGLGPGAEVQMLRSARGAGPLQIKSEGGYYAIRADEASNIHVKLNTVGAQQV